MLQAYIDDSGTGGESVFVLAGFLAPAENWARFSDDWLEALGMHPRMDYLKMSEAHARGWNDVRFRDRLQRFYRIIEDHVSMAFSVTVEADGFQKARAQFSPKMKGGGPYHLALSQIIYWLGRLAPDFQLNGKVDLVADEQMFEQSKILDRWCFIWDNLSDESRALLNGPPSFKSDKDVLPLQAADLLAWWIRRRAIEHMQGIDDEQRLRPSWTSSRGIPAFDAHFGEQQVLDFYWDKLRLSGAATFTYGYWIDAAEDQSS